MNYDTCESRCKTLPISIVQGDKYGLLVRIRDKKWDGTKDLITPEDVQGVKIKLDRYSRNYPGTIVYSEDLHGWIFPLDEDMTHKLYGPRKMQVGIKRNGVVQYSKYKEIQIDTNIIKEDWDE